MKIQNSEEIDAYMKAANSWADDRLANLERSRRTAWWVAIGAAVIAICLALAIVLMLPLKTLVPLTLLVDRQTGFVQALQPLDANMISPDSALTNSFLVQYVLAREGFDRATVQADYRKIALWSAQEARANYLADMATTNPRSPAMRLSNGTAIETKVRSVSTLGDNIALVRFETQHTRRGSPVGAPRLWAAVVRYKFSQAPLSLDDRVINPLGFQVVSYRRSPEALPISRQDDNVAPVASPAATSSQPTDSQTGQ